MTSNIAFQTICIWIITHSFILTWYYQSLHSLKGSRRKVNVGSCQWRNISISIHFNQLLANLTTYMYLKLYPYPRRDDNEGKSHNQFTTLHYQTILIELDPTRTSSPSRMDCSLRSNLIINSISSLSNMIEEGYTSELYPI